MKIKFLKATMAKGRVYLPDEIAEVESALAKTCLDGELAEKVEESKPATPTPTPATKPPQS